ncbi:MAG: distant relative of cell wall-associated hydrolase [Betaproteobacteria bacterium]
MTTHPRRGLARAPAHRAAAVVLCLALLAGCATQIGPLPAEADGLPGGKALLLQNKSLTPAEGGRIALAADLLPGDILLTASAAFVSVGIRALTVSPVSHAALYVGNGEVAEAVGSGVQLRRIETVLAEESVVVALRHPALDAATAERIGEFARAAVGARYDTVGVLLHAPFSLQRRACELPGLGAFLREACLSALASVQLAGGSDDRFFCSQFVLAAYADAGLPLTRAPPHWLAPGDLLHMRAGDVSSLPVEQRLQYVGHLKMADDAFVLPAPGLPQPTAQPGAAAAAQ